MFNSVFKHVRINVRNRHFFLVDVVISIISPLVALYVRFDWSIPFNRLGNSIIDSIVVFMVIKLVIYVFFGLYNRFWRTASIDELARLIYIGVNAIIIETFFFVILHSFKDLPFHNLPYSFPVLDGLFSILMVSAARFSIRLTQRVTERGRMVKGGGDNVLIMGAGSAGAQIVQELQKNPGIGLIPVAFLDDDKEKLNLKIRGIPVIGTSKDIKKIANTYRIDKILIAIPTAPGKVIRKIVAMCQEAELEPLTIPGMNEILSGKVGIEKIRPIQIEDLLRRAPIKTEIDKVYSFLNNRRVLITGAGGSIGSELCRQILKANPSELLLVGHGENSIFNIQNELLLIQKNTNGSGNLKTKLNSRIADIRFKSRLKNIFEEFKPEVIFHAAAHKHVPLMELNPSEAVTNNIGGTQNLIELAEEFDVKNFVMISTDKAVNPTNLMGATKRTAEMLVLDAANRTKNNYVVTRFGNVLGSRGSVVPTFKRQLEEGGPITITHPEIKRYFMTIPEAVQLVLQASVLSNGGEVFVFDMGEPVKIIDMAKDIIKLAGLQEDVDIEIKITGLRPGEKMYEELFVEGEVYDNTAHKKIMIARNASKMIPEDLRNNVTDLLKITEYFDNNKIYKKIKQVVPEFNPVNMTITQKQLTIHELGSGKVS